MTAIQSCGGSPLTLGGSCCSWLKYELAPTELIWWETLPTKVWSFIYKCKHLLGRDVAISWVFCTLDILDLCFLFTQRRTKKSKKNLEGSSALRVKAQSIINDNYMLTEKKKSRLCLSFYQYLKIPEKTIKRKHSFRPICLEAWWLFPTVFKLL